MDGDSAVNLTLVKVRSVEVGCKGEAGRLPSYVFDTWMLTYTDKDPKYKSVEVGCKGKKSGRDTPLHCGSHFVQQIGAWGAFTFLTPTSRWKINIF